MHFYLPLYKRNHVLLRSLDAVSHSSTECETHPFHFALERTLASWRAGQTQEWRRYDLKLTIDSPSPLSWWSQWKEWFLDRVLEWDLSYLCPNITHLWTFRQRVHASTLAVKQLNIVWQEREQRVETLPSHPMLHPYPISPFFLHRIKSKALGLRSTYIVYPWASHLDTISH